MIKRAGGNSGRASAADAGPSRMFKAGVFLGPVFCFVCSTLYRPLHAYSVFLIACVAGALMGLGAFSLCLRLFSRMAGSYQLTGPGWRIVLRISTGLMGAGFFLLLNGVLDNGTPSEKQMPVLRTSVTHGKHGDFYHAVADSPVPALLTLPFDGEETIYLHGVEEYNSVRPGIDQVAFVVKPGFFGFPWIVSNRLVQAQGGTR